jgi:hypothetical protein
MFIGTVNLYPNNSIVIAMVLQRKPVRNLQFVVLNVYLFASALSIVADALLAITIPTHNE